MEWIPKYIKQKSEYKAGDIVTSEEYNAILNLLINQGNHNTERINWLSGDGFIELLSELNGESISQAIFDAATAQIAQLVQGSQYKVSAILNTPLITFVDDSPMEASLQLFKKPLQDAGFVGNLSFYQEYTSIGAPYLSTNQLRSASLEGFLPVNHGRNTQPETQDDVVSEYDTCASSMRALGLFSDGYLWKHTSPTVPLVLRLKDKVQYAVGHNTGTNDSDAYNRMTFQVAPKFSSGSEMDAWLTQVQTKNHWGIVRVNSSSPDFNAELFQTLITKIKALTGVKVVGLSAAYKEVTETLNNKLKAIQNTLQTVQTALGALADQQAQKWTNINSIQAGTLSDGLPSVGQEGDVYILYED